MQKQKNSVIQVSCSQLFLLIFSSVRGARKIIFQKKIISYAAFSGTMTP
jgi:hypothetical protein